MKGRVLIVGNDGAFMKADAAYLQEKNLQTSVCSNPASAEALINEIQPDVLLIDYKNTNADATRIYHSILDNITLARLPIVFTLAAGDVYLVNRSRTSFKTNRYETCHSLLEAMYEALEPAA